MTTSPQAKSSKVVLDDTFIHAVCLPKVTASAGSAVQSTEVVCPTAGKIKSIALKIETAGDDADSLINISQNGTDIVVDALINGITGVLDVTAETGDADTTNFDKDVAAGDVFQLEIEDTGAGVAFAYIVVAPQ